MPCVSFRERGNNLKESAPHLGLGFWIDELARHGEQREVRKKARGGAPLMRGAHKTTHGSNKWQRERGGVILVRGAHFLEEGRHMGERKGRGLHPMLKWSFRKGAPHF